jgi:hypothetical protein
MSLWRRRVVGTGLGVFAGSWLAVFGLGQHAHASGSSTTPAQRSTPTGQAQDPSGGGSPESGDGSYGGYYDDGSTYGGSQDPYTGQGSQSQQSQPPLVTRQS